MLCTNSTRLYDIFTSPEVCVCGGVGGVWVWGVGGWGGGGVVGGGGVGGGGGGTKGDGKIMT